MSQSPNRVPIPVSPRGAAGSQESPTARATRIRNEMAALRVAAAEANEARRRAATAAARAAPPQLNARLLAGQRLIQKLINNTRKKEWESKTPTSKIGVGANGVVFGIIDPNKVLKVTVGNATREVAALRKLLAAGANFVPYVNGNFINLKRTNVNNHIKRGLFPNEANIPALSTYVMQKVGNETLYRYARNRPLTNTNKKVIRSEIARIIKFMHARGISHGDLHAGNILVELTADGKVKKLWVIDFGRYVNIPIGQTEKAAYNALRKNSIHNNYNLFNATRKPRTVLYSGPGNVARRNQNLYREMYGGNNKNLA